MQSYADGHILKCYIELYNMIESSSVQMSWIPELTVYNENRFFSNDWSYFIKHNYNPFSITCDNILTVRTGCFESCNMFFYWQL